MSVENTDLLKEIIDTSSRAFWNSHKEPYLLTRLSTDLKNKGISYKQLVPDFTLKNFIVSELSDKQKIIVHPFVREKIGIIPVEESFEYEVVQRTLFKPEPPPERPRQRDKRESNAATRLLDILALLDKDQLKNVHIPADVLVYLMSKR